MQENIPPIACVAGVRRGRKEERRAREVREDRTREDRGRGHYPWTLPLDIICSSQLTVFLELRSRKTVRFSEQIMSADKYPSILSRQMATIGYLYHAPQIW